jgi:hypothetical protein
MELCQTPLAVLGLVLVVVAGVLVFLVFLAATFLLARRTEPRKRDSLPTAADTANRCRALAGASPVVCSNCGAPREGSQRRCSTCGHDGWIAERLRQGEHVR